MVINLPKKEELTFLVKGGQASPGPPLGPALGQAGLPVGKVVMEINKLTAEYQGMRVPIKIVFDKDTREYKVEVGTPYTSALIMKYAKIEKGSGKAGQEFVGNIRIEDIIEIARIKKKDMIAKNFLSCIRQVIGTCVSMGVKVEGLPPKEALAKLEDLLKQKGLYEKVLSETMN